MSKPVILPSRLGAGRYSKDLSKKESRQTKKDTVWHPVWGERSSIRDHYSSVYLWLNKKDDRNGPGRTDGIYDAGEEIKTRTQVKVEHRNVNASQTLSFDLTQSGGVTLMFVKKK